MRAPAVVLTALLLVVSLAGWRSVFTGGWHSSGDGSYECPDSPWHTFRHPLDGDRFGDAAPLAAACNGDAREVVSVWAVAESVALTMAALVVTAALRSRTPDQDEVDHTGAARPWGAGA